MLIIVPIQLHITRVVYASEGVAGSNLCMIYITGGVRAEKRAVSVQLGIAMPLRSKKKKNLVKKRCVLYSLFT